MIFLGQESLKENLRILSIMGKEKYDILGVGVPEGKRKGRKT